MVDDVLIVEFTVSVDIADVVADWLWINGASAVVESEATDSLFPDVVALTADLPAGLAHGVLSGDVMDPALEFVISARIVGDRTEDQAVARTWRDFAEPAQCGRFLVVPDWLHGYRETIERSVPSDPSGGSVVTLRMEPGDAFGSGTHVTTRLCLEAVGDVIAGDETVLDFGCGTGVLGVASAMIGARSVVAVDIDSRAVEVTGRLAAMNGVQDRIAGIHLPDGEPSGIHMLQQPDGTPDGFDVVLANVLIGVFEEHGPALLRLVMPGGVMVTSGVLVDQRDRLLQALTADEELSIGEETGRDGWLRIILRRE